MIQKVLDMMSNFNRPQALGVVALIFIAQREQTSVSYQWKEWGYSDIPDTLVSCIDELDDDDQFAIASKIAIEFAEDDPTAPELPDDVQVNVRHFTNLLPLKNP